MAPNLTNTEVKILAALQDNPRVSVSELSTIVKVSRPTINKILASLIENEKILLSSGLNAKVHHCKLANVGINVPSSDSRSEIIKILNQCPKVLNIYRTTDQANLLVTLCGEDEQSITSHVNCLGDLEHVEVKYSHSLGTPLKNMAIPIRIGDNSDTPCGRNCYECLSYQNEWCGGCFTYSE
jgi:DNA-binding Lrp family transcriptional regulator